MEKNKGFTLIELLITVAIISAISTALAIILNPAELLRQARDADRIVDITNANNAVAQYKVSLPDNSIGDPFTIYLSLPDTNADCTGHPSLPTPPFGWAYACKPEATYRNIDGMTGWLPINFGTAPAGAPFSTLPTDRTNDPASGLYYTYALAPGNPDKWKLSITPESSKHDRLITEDGGIDALRYEVGNGLDAPN
jgi:prepilin-type N-terminal cleavage/methylation domain-containing protein